MRACARRWVGDDNGSTTTLRRGTYRLLAAQEANAFHFFYFVYLDGHAHAASRGSAGSASARVGVLPRPGYL